LGKEHPRTLESAANLAVVLQKQGKYAEAEEMYRQALELMGALENLHDISVECTVRRLYAVSFSTKESGQNG